ncbi:MAG TPA: bifunctional metallophosphatase/5'-nucleotidase [Chitinophagaceae bacterium]
MSYPSSRRDFLRFSTLAGLGLSFNPLSALAYKQEVEGEPTPKEVKTGQQLVTLLQTTDVHCQLHPHDELFWENNKSVFRTAGGYAQLATYFRQEKKKNPNTFLIDTGDMYQGSQLSSETEGKAMLPILDALEYNLYLPGNWEVVYGKGAMQQLLGGLQGPKVCANMYHDLGEGRKGELIFPPYYTWSVAGIKIGFVGYTDPLVPVRQSPDYSRGIIYTHPEENLEHYVKVLREQEQCDMVILLSHLGLSQQIALANSKACAGVDYIFGGDTHERVRKPIQCTYSKVVEPGAFGSFVGKLDLVVENGKIVSDHYTLVEVDPRKYKADPKMQAVIRQSEQPYAEKMNAIIGYSKVPLYRYFVVENTIDTLIIDALKWKIGTDVVLSNGFRFCPPRSTPDHTGNIPITEGFLYDMLPIESQVRTGKVSGRQLTEWLEKELNNVFAKDASKRLGGWIVKFKGMKVEFKAFDEMGQRVKSITVDGQPLEPEKMYSVCACEREGDPPNMLCRLPGVAEAQNTPYTLHQVVKEYLKVHSPISPLPEYNAVVLDAPPTLLTQVTGVDYTFR